MTTAGPETELHERHSWEHDARCVDGDIDVFFPSGAGSQDDVYAYRMCFSCPVIDACLEHALAIDWTEDWGIWGGTSERQRARIRRGELTVAQARAANRARVDTHLRAQTVDPYIALEVVPADPNCEVDGCRRDRRARAWCETHYRRWKRYGDVYETVPIGHHGRALPELDEQEAS